MDLDETAGELYQVPPEEFVAVRAARQDEAKAVGDRALAKAIGALPKPSTAAWVCNLLVRAHRAEIDGLVELGDLLRDAQQNLAGDELKALNRQRAQLLTALTRQAGALARVRGHVVSTTIAGQVEETLRAAMSDPEAGEALLGGRLTSAMSYSGLGGATGRPELRLVPPAEPAARPARASSQPAVRKGPDPEAAADRRRREQEERRRAAEERRRRELSTAQQAAEEARVVAEEAQVALAEHRRATEQLATRRAELQARAEALAGQLAEAEREAGAAVAALKREERRRTAAEREAADAAAAHDAAVARVAELAAGD
ncbi:hypothetical protein [Blastococcus saxobsidens]|uniref:hypothetical protein n=1 Tax=Blastococcus saxobsidens TaxID=138336 RepID=UPI0002DDACAB|nr:hypothetical protein [Blastococcus saxobsidens]